MVFHRSGQLQLQVVRNFLQGQLPVDDFIRDFMHLWRENRDAEWGLPDGSPTAAIQGDEFSNALDQAFTACDCFSHEPINEFHISETQLRRELQGLFDKALGEAHAL